MRAQWLRQRCRIRIRARALALTGMAIAPMLWAAGLATFGARAFASNGGSRGGGNVKVCFDSVASAQSVPLAPAARNAGGDPNSELIADLPIGARSAVRSIEVLDAGFLGAAADQWPAYTTESGVLTRDLPVALQQAEAVYGRVTQHLLRIIPPIGRDLERAARALPIRAVEARELVEPIADYSLLGYRPDPRCRIATMWNQGEKPGDFAVNAKLFTDPHHSFRSRWLSLLHERLYWLDRHKEYDRAEDATRTYVLIRELLTPWLTYTRLIDQWSRTAFVSPLGDGPIWATTANIAPLGFVQDLMNELVTRLRSPRGKDRVSDYRRDYRSRLLGYTDLDLATRRDADQAIEDWLRRDDFLTAPAESAYTRAGVDLGVRIMQSQIPNLR